MKKAIYIIFLLAAGLRLSAQGLSERTFLVTDRNVYLSGETIWYSAFCMDAGSGRLSPFSAIAYVELHSNDALAATGKVALSDGRGAGMLQIPRSLPTGNYQLIAYTAVNKGEEGFGYYSNARTVSIINASSIERVRDGVEFVQEMPKTDSRQIRNTEDLRIRLEGEAVKGAIYPFSIAWDGKGSARLSVSIYREDNIPEPENPGIEDFTGSLAPGSSFTQSVIPEFEGEIIHGQVEGLSRAQINALAGKYCFLSAPGSGADIYSSPIAEDGSISFFTTNIHGDKDLVLEIEGIAPDLPCHITLDSPFQEPRASGIPALKLCEDMSSDIEKRAREARICQTFDADTLYEELDMRRHLVFATDNVNYHLDDYRRFPLMEEVLTEFIPELKARETDGKRDIQVRIKDIYKTQRFALGQSLMLLDGVPVFDQEKIYSYDPLLVSDITIYPYAYYVGDRSYLGVANFTTYRHDLQGMKFGDNVRIASFKGASVPMAFRGSNVGNDYPDYRRTALWEPLVEIGEGDDAIMDCRIPICSGNYIIRAVGITSEGMPVSTTTRFTVK